MHYSWLTPALAVVIPFFLALIAIIFGEWSENDLKKRTYGNKPKAKVVKKEVLDELLRLDETERAISN
jgi:hypothetical protein